MEEKNARMATFFREPATAFQNWRNETTSLLSQPRGYPGLHDTFSIEAIHFSAK